MAAAVCPESVTYRYFRHRYTYPATAPGEPALGEPALPGSLRPTAGHRRLSRLARGFVATLGDEAVRW
ncbi:hypothetical protein GCM10023319_05640 [Nocardia iowensis]